MITYDPVYERLEDPVYVDLQDQLSSPLVRDFRPLPSSGLIQEEIQSRQQVVAPNGDLDQAVRATGASSIATATPDQFMAAYNSLLVRYSPSQRNTLAAAAVQARPDLANQIMAATRQVQPVRSYYGKDAKDYKEYKGKEIAQPCPSNYFPPPYIITPLTPQINSPEKPQNNGD